MIHAGCCRRVLSIVMGVLVGALALTGAARGQTGACCVVNSQGLNTCIANAAPTQCQANGGIFLVGQACSACDQSGACCFQPAGAGLQCAVMTTWQCSQQPSHTYYGGTCQPTPCPTTPPLGVCCPTTGICQTNVPQSQCPAGSPWYGGLTTCTPNPCQPTGACCTAAGGCAQTTKSQCPTTQWYANTACTPNNPCPQGVCCNLQTGACFPSAQANCPTTFGNWIANGSCATAPCPKGACCLQDGTCHISNLPECRLHGGQWFPNTPCSQANCIRTGACCIPTVASGCAVVPSTQCPSTFPFFAGQTCTPNPCPNVVGACCCPNRACFIAPQSQCQGALTTGTTAFSVNCHWFNGQTCVTAPCPPIGACCTPPNGTCVQATLASCQWPRHWFANLLCSPSPCPQSGACCNLDPTTTAGPCTIANGATACNGQFHPGQACTPDPCPRGGCCNPDTGKCTIATQAACHDHGGLWLGAGVPCNPLPTVCIPRRGACCFAGSPLCVITTASNCDGLWFPNKACAPNPCCPPDYDGRGSVNVSGIFAFLRDWFSGCP